MPLLIDTFNVLHTTGILPPELAGVDVQGLIGLTSRSRHAAERVTLVCDGPPPQQPPPRGSIPGTGAFSARDAGVSDASSVPENFTIRYAGLGRTADELIIQFIRASSAPRRLIVVTSDNAILREARRRRCQTLTSAEFLQQLTNDVLSGGSGSSGGSGGSGAFGRSPAARSGSVSPASLTDAQIQRWIKIFKLDPKLISIPSGQRSDELPAPRPPVPQEAGPSTTPEVPGSSSPSSAAPTKAQETEAVVESSEEGLVPGVRPPLPPSIIEQAERIWREGGMANSDHDED